MAWRNDARERTRDWARPSKDALTTRNAPLWVRQSVVCLFIFFLLLGAAKASRGLSVDVVSFARDAASKDLSYAGLKAWVQSLPSSLKSLATLDIRSFWSTAVTGKPTELAWPVSGSVTSHFGWRPDPHSTGMELHQGIDIDAQKGAKVASVLDGVVSGVRESPEFGLVVEVEHGGGLSSVYGHLASAQVVKDQRLLRGDALGTVGESGNATAPHLHFELRKDGLEVDPMTILPPLVKGP